MPIVLSGRYLDALALLVAEQGRLVPKARFFDEVWRGTPVTDDALTQCVRTLRRVLDDDALNPRFIETVPKHGYRFIAPVTVLDREPVPTVPGAAARAEVRPTLADWSDVLRSTGAGASGGGIAGLVGGLIYGLVGVSDPLRSGGGTLSALLVIACLTGLVGLVGGAGVGLGIGAGTRARGHRGAWTIVGGTVGGMVVGAVVKVVGIDAFDLLFGRAATDFTGAAEGALLGAAIGLGVWQAGRRTPERTRQRDFGIAALIVGTAGAVIPLLGGQLMGGSLDHLAQRFPGSRLSLDHFGAMFGEAGFGIVSQVVTAGLEGMLFGGCVVVALAISRSAPARRPALRA